MRTTLFTQQSSVSKQSSRSLQVSLSAEVANRDSGNEPDKIQFVIHFSAIGTSKSHNDIIQTECFREHDMACAQ